ncbi:fimbrial protein [Escherichia coli]|uniref:fimbrial protein n=1 Tax=Escherichia TaxID=561 RepID=UPI000B4FDC32|nr:MULTISPECIES: fimbrial protein [Escherichia]EGO6581826.1 fimbrial protein [Escherichia coli]EGO6624450.1 fimbrial protein [Escherichia coli]EGO8465307.1 fimbrial protein [Escherichia coli]EGO9457122.1 fimbrial protein [Escherichia coli]EGO9569432.1 fimbrial protein [Escherichia coli]
MKKYIIPFVATTLIFSVTTFAKDVDQGTLTVRGEVVDTTCYFVNGDSTTDIVVEDVVTSAMNQLINNEIYTLKTGSTAHDLEIQCDGNTAPNIEVLASEFDANNFTLNKGTAENVGFAFFLGDGNMTRILPGVKTPLKDNGSGQYFLNLNAQYERTSTDPVTKGSVESTVTIKISAD